MPIHSEIIQKDRIVVTKCIGEVSLADFTYYQKSVWTNAGLYGFDELFDLREGDFTSFKFSDLLYVADGAARLDTLDPNSKIALVVRDRKQTELGRFYINAKQNLPVKSRLIQMFIDIDKACKWLNWNYNTGND